MVSFIRSILAASTVDAGAVRALVGGVSGGLAAMIGLSVTDSFSAQVALVGLLALVFTMAFGFAYNVIVED